MIARCAADAARRLRGAKGDLDALARAIVALSQLATMSDPPVAEAEINPLIVLPAGQGVVAVDALVKLMV